MSEIDVRPALDDAGRADSLEIYNAVWPREAVSADEVVAWEAWNEETFDWVAYLNGDPVGSAVAAIGPPRPHVVFTLITVLAAARGHGAGTALYHAISSWAAGRGRDRLETRAREDDPAGVEFGLHRGFVETSRETGVELPLAGLEPPAVDPPPGIEVTTLAERPGAESGIYAVALEALPDIPGSADYVFHEPERWLDQQIRGPAQGPQTAFVALAGDETVGYATLRLSPARPGLGSHGMTAVKRAWRGRGIAGALKRAQIGWAIGQGLDGLTTSNELRNEPIRRLNASLGYRPAPGKIVLQGPLAR